MIASLVALAVSQAPTFDEILDDPSLKGCVVSACIRRLDGTIIFERNAGTRMVPASNQKLFSAAFAAEKLGPDYVSTTKFWRKPGRIVIDSPGDPMMTYAQLKQAGVQLAVKKGEPILVRQAYRPGTGPGWEADDLPNKYAAPVTAFTVDRGSFELWNNNGKPEYRPSAYNARISTSPGKRLSFKYNPNLGRASVRGRLPKTVSRLDTLALPDPDIAAALALGGKYQLTEIVPMEPPTLEIPTPPLRTILTDCLVKSDNQLAEHLLLKAAAPFATETPFTEASAKLKEFLVKEVGLAEGDLRPDDGSGLSRHNLATTRSLSQLLVWANQRRWGPELANWLAKPGFGTLTGRLEGVPFYGKTGTLDGVVSLSGYVNLPSGETICASVIVNHNVGASRPIRNQVDKFFRKIAEERAFGTKYVWRVQYEGDFSNESLSLTLADWAR